MKNDSVLRREFLDALKAYIKAEIACERPGQDEEHYYSSFIEEKELEKCLDNLLDDSNET